MSQPLLQSHKRLKRRLRVLLDDMADASGFIAETEHAYRPLPESEVWVADVVCLADSREQQITKWLEGSPELVIEVLSVDVSWEEMELKVVDYHQFGVDLVWVLDPQTQSLRAYPRAAPPLLLREDDLASADPHVLGFSVRVRQFFDA